MKNCSPKIILLIGVFCASTSSIFGRYSDAPSLIIATYRLVWTVIMMAPFVLSKYAGELRGIEKRDKAACIVSGIFLAIHFTTFFASLKYTSITSCSVLVGMEVIFAAIGYIAVLKGKIHRIGILAIAITFIGSCVIAVGDRNVGSNAVLGDILAISSAFFVAVYTLIGRVQRGRIATGVYTFLVYTACSVTLLFFDIMTGTPLWGYGVKEVFIGFLLAFVCTVLGHNIFSWSLKYLSPSYVSASKLVDPVFATVMGFLLFRESPKIWQIVGGAVILLGIYLYSKVENAGLEEDGNESGEN